MHTRLRAKVRTEDQIDGAVNQGEAGFARAPFDGPERRNGTHAASDCRGGNSVTIPPICERSSLPPSFFPKDVECRHY